MDEKVKAAYLIPLPVNQVSVPVGEVPAMVAKAMHPRDWGFWEGKEPLFSQLVARVWHRVSVKFQGPVAAAMEVRSILESYDESPLIELLPKLSGNHLYQIYLAGLHKRLLFKAVDDGAITLIDCNPFGAYPVKKNELGMVEFRSADRVRVPDLNEYLRTYGVIIDETIAARKTSKASPDIKPKVLLNEKRGKIILRVLNEMGLNPKNLPPFKNGQSTVKGKIREKVREVAVSEFASDGDRKTFKKAFDRAWSWLAKNNRIDHPQAKE